MVNGPMVAGFMIALVLVFAALFAGTWFHSAIQFQDSHTLDSARTTRPVICSFNTDEFGGKTTGTIRSRDGLMRFDVHTNKDGELSDLGIEVDMMDGFRVMSQSAQGEPYVRLDSYPDLRVQIIEDLKKIMQSDKLHCAPWWSASSFKFSLQGSL